ncbi:MAG TPA: hypothetical protein VGN52_03915 [Burkholderiales bacterium]
MPRWLRYLLACWLCLGAGLAWSQEFEAQGPYTDPASGLVLPESLGSLPRVQAYDYESRHPGLGISCKYEVREPLVFADIYVFNGRLGVIPSGIEDPAVVRMFNSAVGEIQAMGELGRYQDVKLIGADSIPLGEGANAPQALRARFSFTLAAGPVYSHVYGLAVRNHFVKLRFTYRQDQAEQAVPVLGAALKDLARMVAADPQ